MNINTLFAANGPEIHITSSEVFTIGGISITNSMIYAWICSIVIIILLVKSAKKIAVRPTKGIAGVVDTLTDFIMKTVESNLGSRERAIKYTPYFVSIFFFIMITNWLGLLPIVGQAFTSNSEPLFRPFTADLNATFAVAIVSMGVIQYFAVLESGFLGHLRHYFKGNLWNPFTWVGGIFEIFTELTRVLSLAMRLFLNVAVGEIIIAVFSYLGSFMAPITALPFTILEIAVGALQAYIFVILCIIYLSIAIKHGDERGENNEATELKLKEAN